MAISADAVTVELVAKTDGYNQKINAAAANTDAAMKKTEASVGRAENVINMSAARIANGQRNLGRQFADVGASLSSGSSPFVVLAQQLPQIADAITDTGGKAAKFAAVLTGPVGAAGLAVASILATTLLPKLLETGEGVDDLIGKLQENAAKAIATSEAQDIFSRSLYGAAQASGDLVKKLREQNQSQLQVAQSALAAAAALRQQNIQNLRAEASRAAIAVSTLNAANSIQFGAAGVQGAQAGQRVAADQLAAARKRVAVATKALADSEKAVVEANIPLIKLKAAEQADKSAAATGRHQRKVDQLTESFRKGKITVGEYRNELAKADRILASDKQDIRDSKKKPPKPKKVKPNTDEADFFRLFNRENGQTGADFARITDDATEAARRAARQFRAIFGEESKDFPDPFANVAASDAARKVAFDQRAEDLEKLHRQEEQNILSLADLYQSAFEGGVGGIWKQFKQEGIRAIALVLAQLTLGKSLGQALGSLGNTSGGSGNIGGVGATIASLFAKRASGGDVAAGKIYHINEGGSRKELFQPAQSGKIYPTGALQAKQVGGGQSVFLTQTFTLDARGGITTPQLLQYVNQTARTEATRAGQTAYQASPARSARLQTLGT